jgi:hypothetical protein
MQPAGRLGEARRLAQSFGSSGTGTSRVALVLAGARPTVAYDGREGGLAGALARVRAGREPADLRAAILAGSSLLAGRESRLAVVRAPEDAAPSIAASAGTVTEDVVGARLDDRGLFAPAARCGIGSKAGCEILVRLRNDAASAARVRVTATVAGGLATSFVVAVPASSEEPVVLSASPDARVTLRIASRDALAADDVAQVAVPGPDGTPASAVVTLVGTPGRSTALARAFASVPGVTLRLREPGSVSAADVDASDLLVLDGPVAEPATPVPATLLVHPETLPGWHAGGADRSATTATSSTDDALLAGVDLTSLTIHAGAVRRYTTPAWLQPLVVAGDTPLLASGGDARGRLALLAFEPSSSDLPQLEALPILARNLVRWATAWAPPSVAAGVPFALPRLASAAPRAGAATAAVGASGVAAVAGLPPGEAEVADGAHRARVTSASVEPDQPAVSVAPAATGPAHRSSLAPWLLAAAAIGIALELATARRPWAAA